MHIYKGHYKRIIFIGVGLFFLLGTFAVHMSGVRADTVSEVWHDPQFFSALDDVPLMSGLEELPDATVLFDKPEGRIIESLAYMHDIQEQELLDFYNATLPEFGWGRIEENRFFRKKEYLEIYFENEDNTPLVRIMIKPSL